VSTKSGEAHPLSQSHHARAWVGQPNPLRASAQGPLGRQSDRPAATRFVARKPWAINRRSASPLPHARQRPCGFKSRVERFREDGQAARVHSGIDDALAVAAGVGINEKRSRLGHGHGVAELFDAYVS